MRLEELDIFITHHPIPLPLKGSPMPRAGEIWNRMAEHPTFKEWQNIIRRRPDFKWDGFNAEYVHQWRADSPLKGFAPGTTIMALAIRLKNLALFRDLLTAKPELASQGSGNLLHPTPYTVQAASSNDPQFALHAVWELYQRGASLEAADERGCSPLTASAERLSHLDLTKLLFNHRAPIYKKYLDSISDDKKERIKESLQLVQGSFSSKL